MGPAGNPVTLDASGSTDPDGDVLTYTWRENGNVIAGPTMDATVSVNFDLGIHSVELTVDDGNGGMATDVVAITIVDTTPPVITLNGASELTLECAVAYEESGATAADTCDGDVDVTIGGDVVDPNTPGKYVVTYDAIDASGNAATQLTRTVTVVDTTPPVITLLGDDPVILECPLAYAEPGAEAVDACVGTFAVTDITGTVDNTTPGAYTVTYNAVDPSGNAAATVTRTVNVVDTTPPVITLSGDNPLTLIRFSGPYVEPGVTVEDDCDPNPTLVVSNNVDTNLPGSYTVTYTATDAEGNQETATRTVNVIDDPNALEHGFLLLAGQNISVGKVASTDGAMHANSLISVKKGLGTQQGGPTVYGPDSDLTAVSQISVARDNTINGDLTSPAVNLANNVTVNGTVTQTTVGTQTLPSISFTAGGANVTVPAGQTLALAPGSFGTVLVQAGATLEVTTGEYRFSGFTMEAGSHLEVNIPTGPVEINVVTQILLFQNVTMSMAPLGEVDSEYFKLQSLTNMTIKGGALVLGQLIAPNGFVTLEGNVYLRGSVCANFITADAGGANLLKHEAAGSLRPDALSRSFTKDSERKKGDEISEKEVESAEAAEVAGEAATEEEATDAEETEAEEAAEKAAPAEALELVEVAVEVPSEYILHGNYPNPFNPETLIRFGMPESAPVKLTVYDVLGRQVRVLVNGVRAAGTHAVAFKANGLPSGTYLYLLETPQGHFSGTMLLLK